MTLELSREEAEHLWVLMYGIASGDIHPNRATPEQDAAVVELAHRLLPLLEPYVVDPSQEPKP